VIVLDTHSWVWWVSEPDRLSSEARDAVLYAGRLGICPISVWEIATKVTRGRLTLDRDLRVWVRQALARPEAVLLDLTPDIAVRAAELGSQGFHGDPADRLIAATAIVHGAELVTKDRKIRAFPGVRTVW
jgi:PIN domain nuclease of toxin-antitoxin system